MWSTCHECMGSGYHPEICVESFTNHVRVSSKNIPCEYCNPIGLSLLNTIIKGQIWIDDSYEPVTPPSSPR